MPSPIICLEDVERVRGSASEPFRLRIERLANQRWRAGSAARPQRLRQEHLPRSAGDDVAADPFPRFRLEVVEGEAADIAALWARADRDAMTRTRARYFGYVLQTGGLLPFLDLRERRHIRRAARPSLPWTGAGDPGVSGIGHLARRMPARVSIGERQRAAARARSPTDRRSCSPTSRPHRSTRQAPTR